MNLARLKRTDTIYIYIYYRYARPRRWECLFRRKPHSMLNLKVLTLLIIYKWVPNARKSHDESKMRLGARPEKVVELEQISRSGRNDKTLCTIFFEARRERKNIYIRTRSSYRNGQPTCTYIFMNVRNQRRIVGKSRSRVMLALALALVFKPSGQYTLLIIVSINFFN